VKKNRLKIIFLGDFCPSKELSADFFKDKFFSADYIFINLEGVLIIDKHKHPFKYGKSLTIDANHFKNLIKPIKDKVIFTLTNNHSLDLGYDYYLQNIKFLKNNDIKFLSFDNPTIYIENFKISSFGFTESKFDFFIKNFLKRPFKNDILLIHDGFEGFSSWFQYDYLQAIKLLKFSKIIIRSHSHEIGPVLREKEKFFFNGIGDLNFSNMRDFSKGRVVHLNQIKGAVSLEYFDFTCKKNSIANNYFTGSDEDLVLKRTYFNNNILIMYLFFFKKFIINNISWLDVKKAYMNYKYSFWARLRAQILDRDPFK
jgi:hypothetical protein